MTNPLQNRRQLEEEMQGRLKAIMKHPGNRTCSECPEPRPTWAVLLESPVDGGDKLGALCCYNCYSHHFRLGKTVCTVKSAMMAAEWTQEEIEVVQKSGNTMVNAIYEAFLEDPINEKQDMKNFVENKYQHRQFFSEQAYYDQVTLPCMGRRAKAQLKRTSSFRSTADQHERSEETPPSMLDMKRPTLHRSRSKKMGKHGSKRELVRTPSESTRRNSRKTPCVLQAMSDHARRSSRKLQTEFPEERSLDTPSDHHRRPTRRSLSKDRLKAMSDHARRASSSRSRSRERILAMSEAIKSPSSGHSSRSHDDEVTPNPRRRSSSRSRSRESMLAMSEAIHKSPSSGGSNTSWHSEEQLVQKSPRRSGSQERIKALSDHLGGVNIGHTLFPSYHPDHEPATMPPRGRRPQLTRHHSERHVVARTSTNHLETTPMGEPPNLRRVRTCSCDEIDFSKEPISRMGIPHDMVEPRSVRTLAVTQEELDSSSEQACLPYNLPGYLGGSLHSSHGNLDYQVDASTCNSRDQQQQEDTESSLADYVKRYELSRQARRSPAPPASSASMEHIEFGDEFGREGEFRVHPVSCEEKNGCAVRLALESLESSIQPLVVGHAASSTNDVLDDKSVDTAFWKSKISALNDKCDSSSDWKHRGSRSLHPTEPPALSLTGSSLPEQLSANGRAA